MRPVPERGTLYIQCTAPCGTIGDFLAVEEDTGRRLLTPIFPDLLSLFTYLNGAGWVAVPHSTKPTGEYERVT